MKVGDIVKIRPEWQDTGEDAARYLIVEWNEDRGFVIDPECILPINPRMLVTIEMIEEIK
jgi:hypothetical protein